MEFNKKLQLLRKKNGLTQAQLSEKLYISRTAVTKWECGRGFPNIEALKNISKLFAVPIDELLSEKEFANGSVNDTKLEQCKVRGLVFGLFDLLTVVFIFIPLYGQKIGDYVYSVNLLQYTAQSDIKILYFASLIALSFFGFCELLLQLSAQRRLLNGCQMGSLFLHSVTFLFFALSRQPYVTSFLFLFLLVKALVVIKQIDRSRF